MNTPVLNAVWGDRRSCVPIVSIGDDPTGADIQAARDYLTRRVTVLHGVGIMGSVFRDHADWEARLRQMPLVYSRYGPFWSESEDRGIRTSRSDDVAHVGVLARSFTADDAANRLSAMGWSVHEVEEWLGLQAAADGVPIVTIGMVYVGIKPPDRPMQSATYAGNFLMCADPSDDFAVGDRVHAMWLTDRLVPKAAELVVGHGWVLATMVCSHDNARNIHRVDDGRTNDGASQRRRVDGRVPWLRRQVLKEKRGDEFVDLYPAGQYTSSMPLHKVIGHMVCYGIRGRGKLFGKHTGVFFRDAHLRGNPCRGVVETDYDLDVNARREELSR